MTLTLVRSVGFDRLSMPGFPIVERRLRFQRSGEVETLPAGATEGCKRGGKFDGLDAFKAKLRPNEWEPVFAVSNESRVSFQTLYAIASAFSGNAPFRMLSGGLVKAAATEFRWLRNRISV